MTSTKKAVVGGHVTALVDPRLNRGADEAPALITSVSEVQGESRVGLRIFLDTGADLQLSNYELFNKRPAEDKDVDSDASGNKLAAYWPAS